jgi:glycosyltransferase involved in cell wall biosynthesis
MIKVKMTPHPNQVRGQPGGIQRVVENYDRYLPQFDIEIVSHDATTYDLRAGHAGAAGAEIDVEHNHGLWWTGDMDSSKMHGSHWGVNARVISALRAAKEITTPSAWVAHNIARGMHILPHVVPHGVNHSEWQGGTNEGYALWNKIRDKDVCDTKPVGFLAAQFKHIPFVTTFCDESLPNVRTTGRLPFHEMKEIIKCAGVYLSTTKETFGIGTLEAMAAGVPVLGFDYGGNSDIITHRVDGYLAQVDDREDLARGFDYCLRYRDRLSDAARQTAKRYTWERVCRMVAEVYRKALDQPNDVLGVTVVIPSYNYANAVDRAVKSALRQTLPPKEIVVVDDGSDDNGATRRVVRGLVDDLVGKAKSAQETLENAQETLKRLTGDENANPSDVRKARAHVETAKTHYADANAISQIASRAVKYVRQDNAGVATARNHGISLSSTRYICCLDADDAIEPTYLATLVPALESDPLLGVAYTGLMIISPQGRRQRQSGWPPDCDFNLQLQSKNQVSTCCVFRRKAWEQIGGYRQRYAPLGCGTEDAEYWTRLGANGWKMKRITNDPLFLYTLGGRTWDRTQYTPTDWLNWHPWSRDHVHPFASIATPVAGRPSHPVHQYDRPAISVIIPVGPKHTSIIVDALDSLEAQTFRHWEAIVVNDSGKPIDLTPWPYVKLIETSGRKGAGYARNRGTEIASAKHIVYLDADDFLQSTCLERFIDTSRHYPNTWIYPDMLVYRASGDLEHYECEDFIPSKLWRHGVAPITCLYTKEMWEKAGGFDEEIHREDWDFHLRLAKAGICGIHLSEPLLTYRHSTGSRRISGSKRKDIETLHRRYNREEIMANCGSCGKRAKNRPQTQQTVSPPQNWETKSNWPMLEFIGNNRNDLMFRGGSNRRYIAGNNPHHKTVRVHPDDYEILLRLRYFKPAKTAASTTMKAQAAPPLKTSVKAKPTKPQPRPPAEPKPPVESKPVEPKPKPEPTPTAMPVDDIVGLTVAQVRAADLSTSNIGLLIEQESARTPRPRTTVLRMLRVEQRRGVDRQRRKRK